VTLATATKNDFVVELVEKDVFEANIVTKEVFTANLITADIIKRKVYIDELEDVSISNPKDGQILQYDSGVLENISFNKVLNNNVVLKENPDKITNTKFKTKNKFKNIIVYINGLREEVNLVDNQNFEFSQPVENEDVIEVDYIKKDN